MSRTSQLHNKRHRKILSPFKEFSTWLLLGIVVLLFITFISLLKIERHGPNAQKPLAIPPEITMLSKRNDWNFQELSLFFTQLAKKKGAVYAFNILKIAKLPSGTDLHLLAHNIGYELYKQKGINGIKYCTDDFRNACSHSVVISIFIKQGTKAIATISKVCKEAPGGKGAYTMCFHGLGHGVLAYTGYDMSKAVTLCEQTATEEYHRQEFIECVGGVTMEMMSGVHDPQQWQAQMKNYFDVNNPLSPCTLAFMTREIQPICLIYSTPHLFQLVGADLAAPQPHDFRDAFQLCETLPLTDTQNRDACFGGFGKEFIVLAEGRDIRGVDKMTDEQLQRVYSWCQLANDSSGEQSCINYAVNSMYWGGENDVRGSIRFCNVISSDALRQGCFSALTSSVNNYVTSEKEKSSFCALVPKDLQTECRNRLQPRN